MSVKVARHGDLGFRDVTHLVQVLGKVGKMAADEKRLLSAVMVHSPLSIALAFIPSGHAVLFDSHSHPAVHKGAVVAVMQNAFEYQSLALYIANMFAGNTLRDGHLCLLEMS